MSELDDCEEAAVLGWPGIKLAEPWSHLGEPQSKQGGPQSRLGGPREGGQEKREK